jgi:hypothetical protein
MAAAKARVTARLRKHGFAFSALAEFDRLRA